MDIYTFSVTACTSEIFSEPGSFVFILNMYMFIEEGVIWVEFKEYLT